MTEKEIKNMDIDKIISMLGIAYTEGEHLEFYTRRGQYCASLNYRDCYAVGKTPTEALQNLAIGLWEDREYPFNEL